MTTHQTLDSARKAATETQGVTSIIEIEHSTAGSCYICCKVNMQTLNNALRAKPMREIKRLIAEHNVETDDQLAVETQAKANRKAALLAAVPGLEEMRSALAEADRYAREFSMMMDDENGSRLPQSTKVDVAEIAARYPRASLYLKAESYSHANHWAKAKAGEEAMQILAGGGSEIDAAAKLNNWMSDNNVNID